jgi:hypothetical protein
MEQSYLDNRRYNATGALGTCGIPGGNTPTTLGSRYFDFGCISLSPNAAGDQEYLLTASGKVSENLNGISFTVNQGNTKTTNVTAATPMVDKGYASSGTCWVRKKPSTC